jgi:hypothetical protein
VLKCSRSAPAASSIAKTLAVHREPPLLPDRGPGYLTLMLAIKQSRSRLN